MSDKEESQVSAEEAVDNVENDAENGQETKDKEEGSDNSDKEIEDSDNDKSNDDEKEENDEELNVKTELDIEMVGQGLSLLCKTGNGLEHAFVRFEHTNKKLLNFDILRTYVYLRYIDLSKNKLESVAAIENLINILAVNFSNNRIKSLPSLYLPYIQRADFSKNKITAIDDKITLPLMESLNLSKNRLKIISLSSANMNYLHTLELRGNKLKTIKDLNLPNLKNLFIANNNIKDLTNICRMTQLSTLHMRDNPLETLDGFSEEMTQLKYINMRTNKIPSLKEVVKLVILPSLLSLMLIENPVNEEDEYRLETLIILRKLERLDKEMYTKEERNEAQDVHQQRQRELVEKQNEDENEE